MEITNFEYNLLFLFKICVDCGSFSKASQELNVKQPAISYSIKKLENLLNVKLFNRTKSGIELTEEGKILYDYIKEANNSIVSGLNIIDEINAKEIKKINIGISLNIAVVYLPIVLEKFGQLFPNVKVYIDTKPEEKMLEELQEKKLDVVVFNSSKNIPITGLKIQKIKNNEVVCVGNKYYKDLIEDNPNTEVVIPLLMPNDDTILGKNLTVKLQNKNVILKHIMNCPSAILAKEFIKQGLGIGYINSETVKEEIDKEELFILDDDSNLNIYSMTIATQEKNNNIVIKQFKKLFIDEVVK